MELSILLLIITSLIGFSNSQSHPDVSGSYLGYGDTGISYFPSYLGLKMHIRCYSNTTASNVNGPIALFDSGVPFYSTAFVSIIPSVLQNMPKWNISKSCFMDRPGYGWSDSSLLPMTTQEYVIRLRASLQISGLSGKYILVGWSWGSIFVQTYSLSYPKDVVGIVTIDGTDSQWGLIPSNQQSIPLYTSQFMNYHNMMAMGTLEDYAYGNNVPITHGWFQNSSSLAGGFTQNSIHASEKIWLTSKYLKTAIQEFNIMVISSATLNFTYSLKGPNPLKDLPYINIYETQFNEDWVNRQKYMASLSTNSEAIPFGTDHFFPWTNPSAIISAISALASKIATHPAVQWCQ